MLTSDEIDRLGQVAKTLGSLGKSAKRAGKQELAQRRFADSRLVYRVYTYFLTQGGQDDRMVTDE